MVSIARAVWSSSSRRPACSSSLARILALIPASLPPITSSRISPRPDRRWPLSGAGRDQLGQQLLHADVELVADVAHHLLVLDNCESPDRRGRATRRRPARPLPRLRVLATNREPLGILGETLCRPVPPLDRRTGLWPVIADSELVTEL